MKLSERKEILEKRGLCQFCLKHAAELECYGRGGLSKPRCTQAGCDGEHTPGVHKLMGEESAGVNLVAEDEWESEEDEDEEWWVGTVRAVEVREEEEEETLEEMDESEPEGRPDSSPASSRGRTTPGWRMSSNTPGMAIPQGSQRRTGGGARSLLSQALSRTKKKFSTLYGY
jgi:hypothetical protein